MRYLLLIGLITISLMASSGLKKPPLPWREVRAQQQADSTAYQAVYLLDSIRIARHLK